MLYASSNKALKAKMTGIHTEIQCNDATDLKLENVIAKCRQKSYEWLLGDCRSFSRLAFF